MSGERADGLPRSINRSGWGLIDWGGRSIDRSTADTAAAGRRRRRLVRIPLRPGGPNNPSMCHPRIAKIKSASGNWTVHERLALPHSMEAAPRGGKGLPTRRPFPFGGGDSSRPPPPPQPGGGRPGR